MTYYLKRGNIFNVTTPDALDLHELLPVGTYTVKQDPQTMKYFLQQIEGYEVKGKIYGDTERKAERILNTFDHRPDSTGVLLSGEQGSGKTLMAKILSLRAQAAGIPTILINQPLFGEEFNGFLQTIEQPTVVIFDEFEKVYDEDEQEQVLTLLDGVYPSKKLFILTCNNSYRVNEHMKNRPGRIFYHLEYTGLDKDFISEYCEDNLNEKSHTESITRLSSLFAEFNFDILQALVEEVNRYNEDPREAMKMLNAKPENGANATYDIKLFQDGQLLPADKLMQDMWTGNPLGSAPLRVYYYNDNHNMLDATFTAPDILTVDTATGEFTFERGNLRLLLTKAVKAVYNWQAY